MLIYSWRADCKREQIWLEGARSRYYNSRSARSLMAATMARPVELQCRVTAVAAAALCLPASELRVLPDLSDANGNADRQIVLPRQQVQRHANHASHNSESEGRAIKFARLPGSNVF
ncbi:hypothetical protein THAOC_24456 [Thalassiosira oceanica]|uniref:Uncharacterized protein n=1 Tax=Thalassiosira oceanica TaxID=159749 RepID=K0RPT1_THAOC|nr:hypothetical protein THAOC_24456 [Thalassiosira oceanica]|eukprot:EJK55773.1 hypothetical protein THAOC_24456 [Thalassiosira oceanica]